MTKKSEPEEIREMASAIGKILKGNAPAKSAAALVLACAAFNVLAARPEIREEALDIFVDRIRATIKQMLQAQAQVEMEKAQRKAEGMTLN